METKVFLSIDGMTCTNCAAGVKRQIEKKGLKNVNVDFTIGEANFEYDKSISIESIINTINTMGYKAYAANDERNIKKEKLSSLELKLIICALFTIPLLISMFLPFSFAHNQYVHLALTIPVFAIGMHHFGRSALISLRSGIPNMDVLITIGSTAAFVYSLTGTILKLGPDFMFYETAASIITIVLFGNTLEHRSVRSTTSALSGLTQLQKVKAKRIPSLFSLTVPEVEEISSDKINVNDILLVNSGDQVPVDGEIIWGSCSVNESMLTGESIPIEKIIGHYVIGGSILENGSIKMRATVIGRDTLLSKIIELVKNAQNDKPKLQNLADKISAIFVPVVVGLALITFLGSYFIFNIPIQNSLLRGIAVLVISCPCALGLAIPTAVVVGVGMLAKRGVLVKGGTSLEKLAKIKQIVFDKTGTITTGMFKISEPVIYNSVEPEEIKSILKSIEKHSSHPIAKSIIKSFNTSNEISFKEFIEEKGFGVKAISENNDEYKFGSKLIAGKHAEQFNHDLYLIKNGILLAGLDIKDEIKENAEKSILQLKSFGIMTFLLSGDKKEKCEEIAAKIKIDKVYFEKLPDEKLKIIDDLNQISFTAMVGDGINDAPALTKANIGISLSNATNVAQSSAQVVLLKGNLDLITKAIRIGKLTLLTIKQNLFWAFFYNIIAIPIAATGLLSPTIAALAMAFSDVIIVFNSLRMRRHRVV